MGTGTLLLLLIAVAAVGLLFARRGGHAQHGTADRDGGSGHGRGGHGGCH